MELFEMSDHAFVIFALVILVVLTLLGFFIFGALTFFASSSFVLTVLNSFYAFLALFVRVALHMVLDFFEFSAVICDDDAEVAAARA